MRIFAADRSSPRRRGAVAPMVACLLVVLMGMAALSVDVGLMYKTKAQLQRAADSAALAGAWELIDEDYLTGIRNADAEIAKARDLAVQFAGANDVLGESPVLDSNSQNDPEGDVVVGYLHDPDDLADQLALDNPDVFNSVQVRVRRTSQSNGPVNLLFAQALGFSTAEIEAEAVATFKDGAIGYRVNDQTGNADLLPFTLQVDAWAQLFTGGGDDSYTYDADTGEVNGGPDGIPELNIYPGAGDDQLPPGNFGTVDIGSPDNSAADIARQILYGVNKADLAYFGGELKLGSDGTVDLGGDTGLSAGVKDELEAIKGQPRAIPLFSTVSGPGNNAVYTVVGFAGIRIVNVKLTGAMKGKELIVQPAFVVDDAVIAGAGTGSSYFVLQPVRLVR